MIQAEHFVNVMPRRDRWDIFDFARELWHGEPVAWYALAAIIAFIATAAIYQKVTGKSLVKSKRERREARRRRKHVIWEYERSD